MYVLTYVLQSSNSQYLSHPLPSTSVHAYVDSISPFILQKHPPLVGGVTKPHLLLLYNVDILQYVIVIVQDLRVLQSKDDSPPLLERVLLVLHRQAAEVLRGICLGRGVGWVRVR